VQQQQQLGNDPSHDGASVLGEIDYGFNMIVDEDGQAREKEVNGRAARGQQ
jgi:hypothetical protein